MCVPGKTVTFKTLVNWHFFLCLAMLAFICRAIIPPGYMPALPDKKSAVVVLTLCTTNGVGQTLLLDVQHRTKKSPVNTHIESECPFGLAMSQGVLPVQTSLMPTAVGWLARHLLYPTWGCALPSQTPAGPPLGPRAPPANPA